MTAVMAPWTLTMCCATCGATLSPVNAVAHGTAGGACTRLLVMTVCERGHGMEVLVTMTPHASETSRAGYVRRRRAQKSSL